MLRLLLLLLLAYTPAVAEETHFALTANRIVFLGDSITHAGHYIADLELQLRLQNVAHVPEMLNLGLPSETCSGLSEPDHPFPRPDVQERIQRVLEKTKPDVVVACYGMNDGIYHPFSEQRFAEYQRGIREISTKVKAAGARLILLTPPPFDPEPLRGKQGKLLPAGEEKYAWFAIYEGYDDVIARYADWLLSQTELADQVIDVHGPLSLFLQVRRETDPTFQFAHDGVHMDATGHEVMAKTILQAWGISEWKAASPELKKLMKQKEGLLHAAWVSYVGHKRPSVKAGLPLPEAQAQAEELEQKIIHAIEE